MLNLAIIEAITVKVYSYQGKYLGKVITHPNQSALIFKHGVRLTYD